MKLSLYIYSCIAFVLYSCQISMGQKLNEASQFYYTDSLPQPCAGLSATITSDEQIFAMGGYGYFLELLPVASNLIRIYDYQTESWSVSRVRIRTPRMYCAAGITNDNNIIIAGGLGQSNNALASVELYYPELEESPLETVMCKFIGNMSIARRNPVINVLDDGRILITGNNNQPDIVEKNSDGNYIVRPTSGKMHFQRSEHATVKLNDGRICFISGRRRSIEIFNPLTEQFKLMNSQFKLFFDDQAVVTLYDNNILIVGGQNIMDNSCSKQTWLYNPATDTLIKGQTLTPTAREKNCNGISDLQIVDLGANSGNPGKIILLCGGEDDRGTGKDIILDSAWLYLAETNKFIEVGPMKEPHDDFKALALPAANGRLRAIIIAGHSTNDKITGHCEIFEYSSKPN